MPKLTLCVDITDRKIELARVIKKLGNGLLETDGRSEDVLNPLYVASWS